MSSSRGGVVVVEMVGVGSIVACGLLIATGCSPSNKTTGPENQKQVSTADTSKATVDIATHDKMEAAKVTRDVRKLPMFNGVTGAPMDWSALLSAAKMVDVVLVGEAHGHPIGQATEAALFSDLVNSVPSAGLSLEFFERDEQDAVDDYLTGVTNESEFLKAANRSLGNYPFGHREMVEDAKANHRIVIAANAPRRYVTVARVDGYDKLRSLMPEQQRLYVVPDHVLGGRYHDDFYKLMEGMPSHMSGGSSNGAPPKGMTVDDLYRSQNVWDATMADSILQGLSNGVRPVVHIVGEFHVDYTGGTVQRIGEQRSDIRCWTISLVPEDSDKLRDDDKGRADCVIYIGPEAQNNPPMKLSAPSK